MQIPEGRLETLTLSTTNEDISVPALSVTGRMELSNNGGNILFRERAVGDTLSSRRKMGTLPVPSWDVTRNSPFTRSAKRARATSQSRKRRGETLQVSSNNGDIDLSFVEA